MGLWDAIIDLPGGIADAMLNSLNGMLVSFIEPMLEVAKALITINIDPFHFQDLWFTIISIISAFYLLLFLIVGFKFLYGSYDAVQRKEAKEWFKKAVILIIAVNASLLLYALILNLSSGIALTLWSSEFESLFIIENLNALDFLWLGTFGLFLFLAVITLVLRQIVLIAGVMLFPIGIFLYFIPPLKTYGSVITNILGVAIFMNVADVIILIAIQLFWTEFAYLPFINLLAPSLGFLFVALVNIGLIFVAVQKALSFVGIDINVATVGKAVAGAVL